jgi:hypothetical protein
MPPGRALLKQGDVVVGRLTSDMYCLPTILVGTFSYCSSSALALALGLGFRDKS